MQRQRIGLHLKVARLDLGQVEDVVDERQQVVARRLDRACEPHLLVGQVGVGVVAQQLRQDQQRIERRAQFMGHVGEEIGLVAARLLKLARLQFGRGLGAAKPFGLRFQPLRLFLELDVRLLQLDLLLLQPHLRFPERAAVFLEFLVGNAQLLALHLQFLGLALRLLQQVLQFGAEVGGPQRDPDRARAFLQKVQRRRIDGLQEAKLDHAVDDLVRDQRRDDKVARPVLAQCRADGQVTVGHVLDQDRLAVPGHPAQKPVTQSEAVGDLAAGGDAQRRAALEITALAREQRARLRAGIIGKEAQHAVAQLRGGLVALQDARKPDLPLLQPVLPRPRDRRAPRQVTDHQRQPDPQKRRHDAADPSPPIGVGQFKHPLLALARHFLPHAVQKPADRVHLGLAAVGRDQRKRGRNPAGAVQVDRLPQFLQLRRDVAAQRLEVGALHLVPGGQHAERVEALLDIGHGGDVGPEIALIAGQQEPALPGLGIKHRRLQVAQALDDLVRVHDFAVVIAHRADVRGDHRAADDEERDRHDDAHNRRNVRDRPRGRRF